MKKTKIKNWEDLTKAEICYHMSAENIQKLENALINPTHKVTRVLDIITAPDHAVIIRGTFIVDGKGYSFISYDLEDWRFQNYNFDTLSAGNIMIGRIFNESLDSDFLMQVGKLLNEFDILDTYIQNYWFHSVDINDIEYKTGETFFKKMIGDTI